ncbi:MAG: hypothetical protein JRI81_06190 [Deltaproteobacteria bacterium]|nr:hypothetical protein [Deltaproteobacteria bacterium]
MFDTLQGLHLAGFFLEALTLNQYKRVKEELIENLESLKTLCSSRGSSSIAENLLEVEEKLLQNRFHLVILGQFKTRTRS